MISSPLAARLIACAKALAASGVASIEAIVTHALFPPQLMDELQGAGIRSIRSTNSVPHPTSAIALDDDFEGRQPVERRGNGFSLDAAGQRLGAHAIEPHGELGPGFLRRERGDRRQQAARQRGKTHEAIVTVQSYKFKVQSSKFKV